MDEKKEQLLRKYLDQELNAEQEKKVLYMIADDPDMRLMLHFERKLRTVSPEHYHSESFVVPSGFSDRVMNAIEAEQKEAHRVQPMEKLKHVLQSLWVPKQVRFRPAYAFCAALVIMIIAALPIYTNWTATPGFPEMPKASVERVSETGGQVWTRFIYIDNQAESIAIAGDFNNWEPTALNRENINGDQVWTALIPMQRGEHRYMFVKNGETWVTDPLAPIQQDDGFGNKNAVIYL